MTHDPLCPKTIHDEHDHDDYTYYCMDSTICDAEYPCQCDLIAIVREDEREKESARRMEKFGFWHDYRPELP